MKSRIKLVNSEHREFGAECRPGSAGVKIVLVVALLLIALPAQAFAIGITPGERLVPNQPARTFEFTGLILNNDGKEMTVSLDVEGGLKPYISVEPKELNFTADESQKQYFYQVLVPFSIDPWNNFGYIIARENSHEIPGATSISGVLEVRSRIVIDLPAGEKAQEIPEPVSKDALIEQEPAARTTGLVVGKESRAGIFKNKLAGIILLASGLLIMGGLILMGVTYTRQSGENAQKKKSEKKRLEQIRAQEQVIALDNYISKCRQGGISDTRIRQELVRNGWDGKVVDTAFKNQ